MKAYMFVGAMASIMAAGAFAETVSKTVTTQEYVTDAVATRQPKLSGTEGYVVTYGAAAGQTNGRQIVESVGTSTSAQTLPTTGAVVTALNEKQNKINGPQNTVVTYTGTSGGTSSKAVYSTSTAYSGQTGSLAEAGHVNTAVTNAFNAHLTCSDPNQTPANCMVWNINNLSGTYMPQP